jgi:signal transduction histidine kinase
LSKRSRSGSDFESAYERYTRAQWVRFSGISALVAAALIPTFSILDYVVYPDWFWLFFSFRLSCTAIIGLLWLLAASGERRNLVAITMAGALLIQAMISLMIKLTDGPESDYYAGLNLTLIAMGLILPTTLHQTVAFVLATFLLYGMACLSAPESGWSGGFLGNVFFLLSTGIIASFSTYFLSQRRHKEFLLSYQLEQRNSELATLDRQKSDFYANISHELRTPLTLILAPVQDLLEGAQQLPASLVFPLQMIRDNALRLLKLVNDLLDVIRLEEGKDRLERVPVDLVRLVGGMADAMAHLADTKEVALEKTLTEGPLMVRGDGRALEKIFVNLLNNAIKFTDRGGRVRVELREEAGYARICVRDTGIGIPPAELPFIFDRFHQVDGSRTRRYRGTGLGLALVKELAERHGGEVQVDSQLGQGTCIRVSLPLSKDQPTGQEAEDVGSVDRLERLHGLAERMGGLTPDEPDGNRYAPSSDSGAHRPRVLVVEDEPDMRRYLAELLEPDYSVLQARSGPEGLHLVREHAPDLVLLDLMLPEIDGLEVCRRIRSDTDLRQPKVMLLTARVDERPKLCALEQGADDFLTKPFSSVEVKTRLRNLLATARLERDLVERNRSLARALEDLRRTQAQLVHSEKLNALGSLAAGLLHEINNPLNYSLAALQLLGSDPLVKDSPLLAEVVGDIDEGMQRIRAIVSDLHAFAYPSEAQKQRPFDFREALESALRFTAHELKAVEVVQALPQQTRVLGSKSHLVQVLVNLFDNAAQAVEPVAAERPGRVRITGERTGGRLLIRVSDNGVGMDEQTRTRIFDPFFTTREVGKGMGLGLSVCHTIVANHGGRLVAASRAGGGTEMSFDLPLTEELPT